MEVDISTSVVSDCSAFTRSAEGDECKIKDETDMDRKYGLKPVKIVLSRIDSRIDVTECTRSSCFVVAEGDLFSTAKSRISSSNRHGEKHGEQMRTKRELEEDENATTFPINGLPNYECRSSDNINSDDLKSDELLDVTENVSKGDIDSPINSSISMFAMNRMQGPSSLSNQHEIKQENSLMRLKKERELDECVNELAGNAGRTLDGLKCEEEPLDISEDIPMKIEKKICVDDVGSLNSNERSPLQDNVKNEMISMGALDSQVVEQDERSRNPINGTFFDCKICAKSLKSEKSLEKHLEIIHTERKTHECTICGKIFGSMENLKRHEIIHSGQKDFRCNECGKSFGWKAGLRSHLMTHSQEKPYECSICGKRFHRKNYIEKHVITHSRRKDFNCTECGKSFISSRNLRRHSKIHIGEKPYGCHICGKGFRENYHLKEHVKSHFGRNEFHCTECGKSLSSRASWRRHLKIHTGENPYECSICGRKFREIQNMKSHGKSHSESKEFSCQECGKSLSCRRSLVNHLKFHSGENPHECQICGTSFSKEQKMASHIKIHFEQGEFICNECGKSFHTKSHLSVHMLIHTGEKPHGCLCGMRFSRRSQLKRHIEAQSGRKDYDWGEPMKLEFSSIGDSRIGENAHGFGNLRKICHAKQHVKTKRRNLHCKICGKLLSCISSLDRHMKIHSGEKPHKCCKCGKRFREKQNMEKHVQIHSEQSDFSCTECGKSFKRKEYLARHMKTHVLKRT